MPWEKKKKKKKKRERERSYPVGATKCIIHNFYYRIYIISYQIFFMFPLVIVTIYINLYYF